MTPRNKNNLSHPTFVAKQNASACFESSGMSHTKYIEIIELLKGASLKFQKHFEELMTFKAKFGHCNVSVSKSASNKSYLSLGKWCSQVRSSQRLVEKGKPTDRFLCKAEIESLNALGFQWEEAYKSFNERIEELRAFKAKFGHCYVSVSESTSNEPYYSLGRWRLNVRRSRRLIEEGKLAELKLSKAQIESLDALGFQWEVKKSSFDKHIEELRAFKARFGHFNITQSRSTSNKPYMTLGLWCSQVRCSRRLIEEGKPDNRKLCNAQIERLDALGFSWVPKKTLPSSF
jgi:hypothetical protein